MSSSLKAHDLVKYSWKLVRIVSFLVDFCCSKTLRIFSYLNFNFNLTNVDCISAEN